MKVVLSFDLDQTNSRPWLINGGNATMKYSTWMGTGNPNYEVVLASLSCGLKW